MFAILWFLFLAFSATICVVWVLDHNGSVVINWLGYEVSSDILTALLLTIIFAAIIFAISYLLARILALKFPNLFKLLFKKSYIKRLESLIHKHWQGIDTLQQLLFSLESQNVKESVHLQKKLAILIKNPQLNNFFLGKIATQNKDFASAAEYFEKIQDNKYARLMALKAKFNLAKERQDIPTAIAYAKQILSSKVDSDKMAIELLLLYRKAGLWQDARALINEYGAEKFSSELRQMEIAALNSGIAFDFYRKKNFRQALNYAKLALKYDENFLPANEIMLKCLIKRGFGFKASYKIKKLWKTNPQPIYAKIFNFLNRKKSTKKRAELLEKLTASSNRVIKRPHSYNCSNCGHSTSSWSPICQRCNSANSFEW